MTVDFYSSFSKRINSTAQPASSPALSLSCVLKDNSGILHPVLEIYQSAAWNPAPYNYARITDFGRFYFVAEWTWVVGRWEARLDVDPLASWKTQLGANNKYILRSASQYNPQAIDTFYPTLADQPDYSIRTASLGFSRNFSTGTYIVGIANRETAGAGAVTYYMMTASQMRSLVEYMLPQPGDPWSQGFVGLTDVLYRSLYSPFDYIKSCMWFPFSWVIGYPVPIMFGNYEAPSNVAVGQIVDNDTTSWAYVNQVLSMPSNWATLEGKYKVNPYAHLFLVCNPWGIIELNPLDFADATAVTVYIYPDLISGDCMMKIYKTIGSTNYFITERNARIAVDINLSATSVDLGGILKGAISVVGGIAGAATGGAAAVAAGILTAAGGVGDAIGSSAPTLTRSIGESFGGARAMEGELMLIYTSSSFAQEDNAEFGKPLLAPVTIGSLTGYIKCADPEFNSSCYPEEKELIGGYLTGGFYYE